MKFFYFRGPSWIRPFILRFRYSFIFAAVQSFVVLSHAQLASPSQLNQVLLGSEPVDLLRQDLNADSVIDVADLVARARFLPSISFTVRTLVVNERDAAVVVTVHSTEPYTGAVPYTVGGSATVGSDFAPLSGSVFLNGTTASISITLTDDTEIEGTESIALSLDPPPLGAFYLLGGASTTVVSVGDNDATWSGDLHSSGRRAPVALTITETDGSLGGSFDSDGSDGFPSGTWPVTLTQAPGRLEMSLGPFPVSADNTALGQDFTRNLTLITEPGVANPTHVLDLDSQLDGTLIEELEFTSPAGQSLTRVGGNSLVGTFSLRRQQPQPERIEPQLIVLP